MSDDLDPADWLASQFGQEEPEKPARRRGMPAADRPAPPQQPAPAAEPPAQFFPVTPYTPPPDDEAPTYVAPPAAPPLVTPPATAGGGFSWGLTPGGSAPGGSAPGGSAPEAAAPATPPAAAPPVQPVQPSWPPTVEPVAPPAAGVPASDPFAALFEPRPTAPVEPVAPAQPAAAELVIPEAEAGWDVPTVATPIVSQQPAPTVPFHGADIIRQEFPGFGVPVDRAIEGVTEVFGAQPIGLGAPEDEGIEVSALDSLFGDSKFVEYEDGLIPALPPRASGSGGGELVVVERPRVAQGRPAIPRLQKILMSVAGGLVAVLLLIVLFLAGQRIAASTPAPAVVADPTPTASAGPVEGPLPPGEYYWDRLLGGECLAPFTSPWADTFTVVQCTESHPAQLVLRGTFPDTVAAEYPGVDELQKLAASLCIAPTVIDYAATSGANDVQVLASFAADDQDWLDGNRTFYCFASRTGGAEFTSSIAVPQPLLTATPTATP